MRYVLKGEHGFWNSCGWGRRKNARRYPLSEAIEVQQQMFNNKVNVKIDLETEE